MEKAGIEGTHAPKCTGAVSFRAFPFIACGTQPTASCTIAGIRRRQGKFSSGAKVQALSTATRIRIGNDALQQWPNCRLYRCEVVVGDDNVVMAMKKRKPTKLTEEQLRFLRGIIVPLLAKDILYMGKLAPTRNNPHTIAKYLAHELFECFPTGVDTLARKIKSRTKAYGATIPAKERRFLGQMLIALGGYLLNGKEVFDDLDFDIAAIIVQHKAGKPTISELICELRKRRPNLVVDDKFVDKIKKRVRRWVKPIPPHYRDHIAASVSGLIPSPAAGTKKGDSCPYSVDRAGSSLHGMDVTLASVHDELRTARVIQPTLVENRRFCSSIAVLPGQSCTR